MDDQQNAHFVFASYQVLSSICDGKAECVFQPTVDLFGEPCEDTAKYLDYTYNCKREFSKLLN